MANDYTENVGYDIFISAYGDGRISTIGALAEK